MGWKGVQGVYSQHFSFCSVAAVHCVIISLPTCLPPLFPPAPHTLHLSDNQHQQCTSGTTHIGMLSVSLIDMLMVPAPTRVAQCSEALKALAEDKTTSRQGEAQQV